MSDEELVEALLKVKGIGVWTCHMHQIFALGRPDVLPVGDLGVRRVRMLRAWRCCVDSADHVSLHA